MYNNSGLEGESYDESDNKRAGENCDDVMMHHDENDQCDD
jgi:hypothetical protein